MGSILSRTEQTERGLVGYVKKSDQKVLLDEPGVHCIDLSDHAGIGPLDFALLSQLKHREVNQSPDGSYFLFGSDVARTIGIPPKYVFLYCPYVTFRGVPISEVNYDRTREAELIRIG
jgi:hypothetical protein